ncbi:uncharacterized protein HD556DRAFT_1305873 [Suillus plorans]|uniref:Uncharacterized protein n=1 Tax=Suillus plorans TaxID=116603 RepID=A0A9P7DNG2_9AGAM|nr:uncharacterized protein HD556DRAFT_1305873 [Suillus plorans]KAG1799036.1 hypothetical protein HD556DRAFT_1305873 [Suillus plorans]
MESGQSGSQDHPVACIPFTPAQRQDLDQIIGNAVSPTILQIIQDSDQTSSGLVAQDYAAILDCIIREIEHALRRNHMENVLNNDISTPFETVQQHPELCKIIHNACQTGCFSTICDTDVFQLTVTGNTEILHLPNTSSPILADLGFTRVLSHVILE